MPRTDSKSDLLGALEFLVLKTLAQTSELHGYGIVLHIQRASDGLLSVEEGSLYPALHRMQQSGLLSAKWGLTETNRKARFYRLTAAGKKQLLATSADFDNLVKGVRAIFRYA